MPATSLARLGPQHGQGVGTSGRGCRGSRGRWHDMHIVLISLGGEVSGCVQDAAGPGHSRDGRPAEGRNTRPDLGPTAPTASACSCESQAGAQHGCHLRLQLLGPACAVGLVRLGQAALLVVRAQRAGDGWRGTAILGRTAWPPAGRRAALCAHAAAGLHAGCVQPVAPLLARGAVAFTCSAAAGGAQVRQVCAPAAPSQACYRPSLRDGSLLSGEIWP